MSTAYDLTTEQRDAQAAFHAFAQDHIVPRADGWDRKEQLPRNIISAMAECGYLASFVPERYSGAGLSMMTYGLLHEEIGRACSSARGLLTAHDMVACAIQRWGDAAQREAWLPKLASGACIAAFALSEPEVGSDAKSVATSAITIDDGYLLNGRKKWITLGQIADLFLVFARGERRLSAFLVERDTSGLTVAPIRGMLGLRAGMLAELTLENCCIPQANLIGRSGAGLGAVAAAALDLGRYSVACGCVGLGQACLDASLEHTGTREQFGAPLKEHQLVSRMITDMMVNVEAARLMCRRAGALRDAGDPASVEAALAAKYFASTMVTRAATDAVQLHGAVGCSAESPVQRYWRDARIMEVIEGSTEILQLHLAHYAYRAKS